ncbi:Probable purine permease 10 [Linum grandiflorum]
MVSIYAGLGLILGLITFLYSLGLHGEGLTISRIKYMTGFFCTLAVSVLYSLIMSLTEFTFTRVIKRLMFKHVMDMNIYFNLAVMSV